MPAKKVRVSAFMDATLKTTALLTFLDPENQEPVTDEFTVVYYALSPKKAAELDAWIEDYDRRYAALEARREAHEGEESKRRLKAEAEGEAFVAQPFTDPEEAELKHGLAQLVARMVQSIPDIVEEVDGEERPVEITADLLSTFAAQNLRSIRDAVRKHAATDPTKPVS